MKISQLIEELQDRLEYLGDVEVLDVNLRGFRPGGIRVADANKMPADWGLSGNVIVIGEQD